MGDWERLQPLPQPRRIAELTPKAKSYKAFKVVSAQQESSRVTAAAFSPVAPHQLAVASGTKVSFWKSGEDGSLGADGSVSKFKNFTQCVSWRSDGRLLLAGEASGSCAVIETTTKKVLRRLRGHGDDAVTCAAFSSLDKGRAATGGRDGRLRLWDVTTCTLLQTVEAHSDSMKYVAPGVGGPDLWLSAGYDRQVRLWDLRASGGEAASSSASAAVFSVDHGHAVEAAVAFPGGNMLASAGGPEVRLWDVVAGGRLVQAMPEAHSKVVTGICLDSKASVMVTVAFDGLAKVFSASQLEHLYSFNLPAPATTAAWRPDDCAFAVGLEDGQWQVRLRKTEEDREEAERRAAAKARAQLGRAKREGHLRGAEKQPDSGDEVVESQRPFKKRESQIDFLFRKYEYRKACEIMVHPMTAIPVSLSIADELMQRQALSSVWRDRDEDFCLGTLQWLLRCFGTGDALQQRICMEALHSLLDSSPHLQEPSSSKLLKAFNALSAKITQELKAQEALAETSGMIEVIMAAA